MAFSLEFCLMNFGISVEELAPLVDKVIRAGSRHVFPLFLLLHFLHFG
jgi:hypothetical protein